MKTGQILLMQGRVGAVQDGFWGPRSIAACQNHLRSLMPDPHPWPFARESDLLSFYGKAGDEAALVNLPAPVPMMYEGRQVRTIRVHWKCAESLKRVLIAVGAHWPEIASDYFGCYANRPMRGTSSAMSLHARGAAIDLAANTNGNHTHWPTVADMPLQVMECFAREGWLAAGAFWSRDAMHFQATR